MKDGEPKIYIPEDAKINVEKGLLPPPPVEYEERKKVLDLNAVKDVTKGEYGKRDE